MIVLSVESAVIAALLLLTIEKNNSGIIVVDSNELHEPQEIMLIERNNLIDVIPPMVMDIPLAFGYASDHYVPKHSGLASLKVIRKHRMTLSGVRIRDGPYLIT